VLDHVAHHDRVEAAPAQVGLEEVRADHVQSEPLARIGRGELARLDAERVPAALARLGEEKTHPAAEVYHRPGRV
jgi:hypothetical protein